MLEVIALTRSELRSSGTSLQTRLADRLPLILGDRIQLQQVILNLILNAIEAMNNVDRGSRELDISTTKETNPEHVMVAVRDTGPGLKPENLNRIFEPFYTTKSDGMGMGLSICRYIIEEHGGRLWATGKDGLGAVFQFTIPLDESAD